MSEKLPKLLEAESHQTEAEIEPRQEALIDNSEGENKGHEKSEQLEENLAEKVESKAISKEEHKVSSERSERTEQQHPAIVNKQLKEMAYERALTRTRKHLSIPSRLFSKAIHSKILDRPSEAIGNTVARPSSMLGGAFFALVGTSLLLWITKKYGYEYNYLATILMFGGGMIVGLIVESIFKLIRHRR